MQLARSGTSAATYQLIEHTNSSLLFALKKSPPKELEKTVF